jgi:mannose-6-phosphate isomerase-like protein (cupin superfamily)
MGMRRVVTGQTADGKSVFIADEVLAPKTVSLVPGTKFHQVWGSDDTVVLPTTGSEPAWTSFFPPVTGFRFLVWTMPPQSAQPQLPEDLDIDAALAELHQNLPGLTEVNEPDHPGMHTTDTIDFDLVLSGEVWLELDDGEEVKLGAGDCVVQNGTRHAWHNRGAVPVRIATALVGAQRA